MKLSMRRERCAGLTSAWDADELAAVEPSGGERSVLCAAKMVGFLVSATAALLG